MNSILLEAGGSGWTSMLFLVAMFGVMYFFIIMPQQKRQKEAKKFRETLAKGQEVITAGGILGTIIDIKDEIVTLEIARSVSIKIEKSSLASKNADEKKKA